MEVIMKISINRGHLNNSNNAMNFYDVARDLYLYLADIQIQIKKCIRMILIAICLTILELICISIFI